MTNTDTTTDTTYNGWTNYETWAASLWMSNDEASYNESRRIVAEPFEDEDDEYPRVSAADALKEWIEETVIDPLTENVDGYSVTGLAVDLLRGAFSSIDWMEIVDNIRSEES